MCENTIRYQLRSMQAKDIDQVVVVHMKSFQGFFLTFLGAPFLKAFYSFIRSERKSISIVAESLQDHEIIGFVVGSLEPSGFYSRAIKKKLFSFLIASLPAFLQNPRIIGRLLRALKKPKEMKKVPADCELMSIGVLPEWASQGIGKELEKAFSREAKNKNARCITLTTDKINNDYVNKFYEKCSYVLFDSYVTPEGRAMNRYIKSLQ